MEKNNEVNTIESPLILRWSICSAQYKVNKPLDQSGEYVNKSIVEKLKADNEVLLNTLKDIVDNSYTFENGMKHVPNAFINSGKEAIKQCESK